MVLTGHTTANEVFRPESSYRRRKRTKASQSPLSSDDRKLQNFIGMADSDASQLLSETVFIEARLKDDIFCENVNMLSQLGIVLEKTIKDADTPNFIWLWKDLTKDENWSGVLPDSVISVKAVEYASHNLCASKATLIRVDKMNVSVKVYKNIPYRPEYIYSATDKGDPTRQNAQIYAESVHLPSDRFDGLWDRLIFEDALRDGLVQTLTNMVKFGKKLCHNVQVNRLVLLYGPPGTGKTSLCQGLAQKISIRLGFQFTKLIQVNAHALHSKFFGESSRQLGDIFNSITEMCESNKDLFVCVLIDEIESLVSSRSAAVARNEIQDAVNATNAFILGLDRVRMQQNLIILCTSNLVETLDAAFVDRCGYVKAVPLPSIQAAYEIVRGGLEILMDGGIIKAAENDRIRTYQEVSLMLLSQPEAVCCKLWRIVEKLVDQNAQLNGVAFSGRFLGQLPEKALQRYLYQDDCYLGEAVQLIERFLEETMNSV